MERKDNVQFQEHNEQMVRFRQAHGSVVYANQPKCDQLTRLGSMPHLKVTRPVVETGGSRPDGHAADWSTLVPALRVASYKLSPN